MLAEHLLNTWRRANESRDEFIVYHLGERGLCAEFTDVVWCMIYGWENGLQLALDSSEFARRHRRGWEDYFVLFCRTASDDIADRVRLRRGQQLGNEARSGAAEAMANAERLEAFTRSNIRFGDLTVHGFREITKLLSMAIFRLNESTAAMVDDARSGLDLPASYAAIDIRRGDEDRCYPCETYLEQLGDLGRFSSLFVMSDDGRAAEEVRSHLRRHGAELEVCSLGSGDPASFGEAKLRSHERFLPHAAPSARAVHDHGDDAYGETVRLLAEMLIAADAVRFVSTRHSDVGAMVQFLHWNPDACRCLQPEQVREPASAVASAQLFEETDRGSPAGGPRPGAGGRAPGIRSIPEGSERPRDIPPITQGS